MNNLKLNAYINNGHIEYYDDNHTDKFNKFKQDNESKNITIIFENADSPEYFQHKYYRGYLLKDITYNESEIDTDYIHDKLKEMFLFIKCNSLKDIPSEYRKRCNRYINEKKELIGWTPSTANLTYKEMKEYIKNCELYLSKIGGHLGDCCNLNEAKENREKAGL